MSMISSLNKSYCSFFWNCSKFAFSPYTATFKSVFNAGSQKNEDPCSSIIAASVVTGLLTFVVPVLPVLASFTFALAAVAMLLGVATMFATYPTAAIADMCLPSNECNAHQELCF